MTQPAPPVGPQCDMPGHPGPAGHVNSCQLCPGSPTYWRGKTDATPTEPACRWTKTPAEVKP